MIRMLSSSLLLLICSFFLLAGCGGGSQTSENQSAGTRTGSIVFNITWPTAGRVIPAASQSLVITVSNSTAQVIATRTIPRPAAGTNTTSVRFDSLPVGVVTILVQAFPKADGTGVIQAAGSANAAIIAGITTSINIDPSSTVDHLDLLPNPLQTIVGITTHIAVSPRNSNGDLVLVAPSSLLWTSSDVTTATVDQSGNVTSVKLGSTSANVVDKESGKVAVLQINVVPAVTIAPPNVTLTLGDQQQFTATVTGLANNGINFSVQEDTGGSITSTGLYTAPNIPGTFHVIATSTADPTRKATATVIVQDGSGTVIIK